MIVRGRSSSFNSAERQEIPAAKKRNNLPSGRFVLSCDRW
jgi:hypothetical protein